LSFYPHDQVFVAAIRKRKQKICPSSTDKLHGSQNSKPNNDSATSDKVNGFLHIEKFRWDINFSSS